MFWFFGFVARECGSGSEQSDLSLTLHRRHLQEGEARLGEKGCASALQIQEGPLRVPELEDAGVLGDSPLLLSSCNYRYYFCSETNLSAVRPDYSQSVQDAADKQERKHVDVTMCGILLCNR